MNVQQFSFTTGSLQEFLTNDCLGPPWSASNVYYTLTVSLRTVWHKFILFMRFS